MSVEIDKLKYVGVQKIYEKTHIPLGFIRAILDEDFDIFTKIQFSGFISIIEREYAFDLSNLREKGLAHLGEVAESSVFVEPKRKKSYAKLYIFLALIIFAIALMFTLQDTQTTEEKTQTKVDNTLINNVKETIKPLETITAKETNSSNVVVDINESTVDLNATKEVVTAIVEEKIEEKVEKKKVKQSLVIRAKSQVWIGYINVKTGQKYSKILKGNLALKAEKHWIFSFGHPYVKIAVNGKVQKFKSSTGKLYEYKDNSIKMITRREFKKLNRGRLW